LNTGLRTLGPPSASQIWLYWINSFPTSPAFAIGFMGQVTRPNLLGLPKIVPLP
jgi:hypothetical protein